MWNIEVTDTFGGEANYCWVNRSTAKAATTRGVVRAVKAAMGLTGKRCDVYSAGGHVEIRPVGKRAPCIIGFADWADD